VDALSSAGLSSLHFSGGFSMSNSRIPTTKTGRLRRGLLTPRTVYRDIILKALLQAPNHTMKSEEIQDLVARRMENRFTPADLSELHGGGIRWVNNLQWTRKRMVMDHLLESTLSAGHGVWVLAQRGIAEARSLVG
jgi:hypothetical protein